jgi:hypothetical protein
MPIGNQPFNVIFGMCQRWQQIAADEPNNPYAQFMRMSLTRRVRDIAMAKMRGVSEC